MNGNLKKTAIAAVAALALGAGVAVSTTSPAEAYCREVAAPAAAIGDRGGGWLGPGGGPRHPRRRDRRRGDRQLGAVLRARPLLRPLRRRLLAAAADLQRLGPLRRPADGQRLLLSRRAPPPLPRRRLAFSAVGLGRRPPPRRPEEEAPLARAGPFRVSGEPDALERLRLPRRQRRGCQTLRSSPRTGDGSSVPRRA